MSASPAGDADGARSAPDLDGLRDALERIDELPLEQRVALFEATNDAIAQVLAELDEV